MGSVFKSEFVCLVTTATQMQGLLKRWGSKATARFRMSSAKASFQASMEPLLLESEKSDDSQIDFCLIEDESENYEESVEAVKRQIDVGLPIAIVPKEYLPNFLFENALVVVVVGHDGLVANTAKYVRGKPIIGINPDPKRNDGILLPFQRYGAGQAVQQVLAGRAKTRTVSLGQVVLNDGQTLLAFNDFFVGCKSHTSARYRLRIDGKCEVQSSSGIIVSTGAGSTGWMSSVFHMARGFSIARGGDGFPALEMDWEDRRLAWAVREPFLSKHSDVGLVAGLLNEGAEMIVESLMPSGGVIFSDGIESDPIEFNSGSIARIRISEEVARLVV
jgi:NAD kinase